MTVDHFRSINYAHDEAGHVILSIGIEAGHLRRLSAKQHCAVIPTSISDSRDYVCHCFGFELAGRNVIEKKQRPRTLDQNVVHTVIDEVSANRIVNACEKRDL